MPRIVDSLQSIVLAGLLGACPLAGRAASASTPASNAADAPGACRGGARTSPIGTNLAAVRDWSTERPFADLFKQSRAWISNTEEKWDDGQVLDVDARGWVRSLKPGQRARSLVAWGAPIQAGDYVVTWSGVGNLDFWPQRSTLLQNGRAIVHAAPEQGGLAVTITETDPANPVRDIHVWPRALEGQRWNPTFLAGLKGYAVLRFMDWMETNESTTRSWAERPRVEDARWSVRGVPIEVMIDLANTVGADPWLTIPHTWTNEANSAAATFVRAHLRRDLSVWVEHSNEVWNGMFPQASHAQLRGQTLRLAREPFEAQLRYHAHRSVEIFSRWEERFTERPHRLVRVLGSMAASPWASELILSTADAAAHADVLAIAPYFGSPFGEPPRANQIRSLDQDAIFSRLLRNLEEVLAVVREQKVIATRHNLRLVAYEGGQHLVGVGPAQDDEALTQLFETTNRNPRMASVYARYLAGWRDAGGELFVHYLDVSSCSKFGCWGARESLGQGRSQAPKWNALLAYAEANPCWW